MRHGRRPRQRPDEGRAAAPSGADPAETPLPRPDGEPAPQPAPEGDAAAPEGDARPPETPSTEAEPPAPAEEPAAAAGLATAAEPPDTADEELAVVFEAPLAGPAVAEPEEEAPAAVMGAPAPDAETVLRRRLARVHLRTGSLALARAELESMAARGELDASATVDLAEARWRTGDPTGAGEAASASLAMGAGEPIAFVIAAEAAARAGNRGEALNLVNRAALGGLGLEALYAGIHGEVRPAFEAGLGPGSPAVAGAAADVAPKDSAEPTWKLIEPEPAPEPAPEPEPEPEPVPPAPAATAEPEAATPPEATAPSAPEPAPEPEPASAVEPEPAPEPAPPVQPEPAVPANPAWRPEVASAASLLEAGDSLRAAISLAVALRLDPDCAGDVLYVIGPRRDAALDFVRGDALHLQGRHAEAIIAYRDAATTLARAERGDTQS
jgi:hypothetical protein